LFDRCDVEWKKLGELGELVRGNGLQKKDFTETGVPAIHYGQLYTYYGLFTETTKSFVSPELARQLRKVDKGDVVLTNTSEDFEGVCRALVYLGDRQAVTGGHATVFKPKSHLLGKYFAYFTQTEVFSQEKRKHTKGTKVLDVSATDMAKLSIPIPCPSDPKRSLEIQGEIVRILDTFTELTAELTVELTARKKQYNYYRDQLLRFDDGDVEWKTLGELVATIKTGKLNANAMVEDGEYPFFTCDANPFRIDTYAFDTEAIIVSGNGSQVGHINYYNGKFNAYQRTYVLADCHASITMSFLLTYLKAHLRPYVMQHSKKGSVPYITMPMLQGLQVPVPSIKRQTEITQVLDKFDILTSSITEGLPREIELRQNQYEYYRDLLLSFPKPDDVAIGSNDD
jgi:type I restriction enzyme S subunit